MKTIHLLVYAFLSFPVYGQNYEYLNASTGNDNEFPVDQDSNIYMFHGNRLVKTDQHINVVWAKTYDGISFTNLLLSKTGSIYFLGTHHYYRDLIGKLTASGQVAWARSIKGIASGVHCERIWLDRNDDLVITGTGFLLKTDTTGTGLKFATFHGQYSGFEDLSIVSDSAGFYKLFGVGPELGGSSFRYFTYSDVSDTITRTQVFPIAPGFGTIYNLNWRFVRSKRNNHFYVRVAADVLQGGSDINLLFSFTTNGIHEWTSIIGTSGYYWQAEHVEDDERGNSLVSISNGWSSPSYTSLVVHVDSSGIVSPTAAPMLSNYPAQDISTSTWTVPAHAGRVLHYNNYYFDVGGFRFPTNPLTIQRFDASMTYSCAATISTTGGPLPFNYDPGPPYPETPTASVITSFTLESVTSTTSPISFSVSPQFCILNGTGEFHSGNRFDVFPNPTNGHLHLSSEFSPGSVEILDLCGRRLREYHNTVHIDLSSLPSGAYFLRFMSQNEEVTKKIIVQR